MLIGIADSGYPANTASCRTMSCVIETMLCVIERSFGIGVRKKSRLLVCYCDRLVERSRADDCLKHGDPVNDLFGRDRIGTFTVDGCGKPF
jgi:hypothetical protein